MDFVVIGIVAFAASGLTFFSGFGLGTLLLPAFALFFSVPIALAATGIVHLLNNLFKGTLVRKNVHWPTVLKFGLPAIPAAILGALALTYLDQRIAAVLIGIVLIVFAVLELQPWFQRISLPKSSMFFGGLATGFMGGISGQQGALRSMFLLKSDFTPQQFIATGVLIAVLIDLARIPTYAVGLMRSATEIGGRETALIACATFCAFLGAWLGSRFVQKTTYKTIRYIVAALMIIIGILLVLGVLGT
jgi:uncharacterized protein